MVILSRLGGVFSDRRGEFGLSPRRRGRMCNAL